MAEDSTRRGPDDVAPPPTPSDTTSDTTPPTPPAEDEAGGQSWRTWALASVAAAVVVAVGVVALNLGGDDSSDVVASEAEAAPDDTGFPGGGAPGAGGFGASGEVTEISGSTLTVEVPADASGATSTMTVETDDDTEITETVEGSPDDLAVGDEVVVAGEESDGVVAATTISQGGLAGGAGAGFPGGDGPPEGFEPPDGAELPDGFEPPEDFALPDDVEPGGPQPPRGDGGLVAGAITSIDGSTLTLETDDGEVHVEVADDTVVTTTEARSLADVEVGESIRAVGEIDGSVVSATNVQIGSLGFGRGGPGGGFGPASDDVTTG